MFSIFRQIFIGVLLGLFVLAASLMGYFYLNQDKIVQLLVKEINRRIETKIDVGNITMSFWERFPAVSVKFTDVVVHNPKGFQGTLSDTLLVAKTIYADLDLSTLVSETPQINRIYVSSGAVNLETDRYGNGNYQIGKTDDNNSDEFTLNLNISGLEMDDMQFSYKAFSDVKVYRALLT
ncbi:MAG: AsmA family protein, partial [Salinivirgaceae bacterium]